jgi:hypothetical protein
VSTRFIVLPPCLVTSPIKTPMRGDLFRKGRIAPLSVLPGTSVLAQAGRETA